MTQTDTNENKKHPPLSRRSRARMLAMQGVYQWLITGYDYATIESQLQTEPGFNKADLALFHTLLEGTLDSIIPLHQALEPFADRPIQDISLIEHAVLVVAAYELMYTPETPFQVILNEAIELTKRFGGSDGHRYVNGILNQLARSIRATEVQQYQ